MKKIYLSAFASIFSVGMTMAQIQEVPYLFNNNIYDGIQKAPNHLPFTAKALGVEIWTENFDDGSFWTIDNDGQAGGAFGWSIDAVSDGWWSSTGINSTSGGGFAELSNGVPQTTTQALGVTYTMTSNVIDIPNLPDNTSNTDQVLLQYEEFGALFNDAQVLEISTGGNLWVPIRANDDHYEVLSQSAPNNAYPNPSLVSINLAPYITGNANSVQLRFSWTTRFPGSASNPNVWVTYGWYIDDMKIITNPDNNITSESSVWGTAGLNYRKIPLSQQAPIDFTTNARNNGINTQTDVQLNVDITGAATFSGSSPAGVSIAAGDYDSLVVSTQFTPSGLGTYDITWGLTQNEVDDVPTDNDNADISFEVTNFTYARDNGTQTGAFSNGGDGFVLGGYYDIFANDNIYSVDVRIAPNAVVGSSINARIYSIDPNATTLATALILEDQSIDHTIVAGEPGSFINLDLVAGGLSGFPLIAGETYFLAVGSDGDGGLTNGATIGLFGPAISQTCFLYNAPDDTWYLAPGTPMIRMNLDPASTNVGLDENSLFLGAEVFPNPATDNVSVRYSLAAESDVTIKVTDLTGKVIASFNEGSKAEGTHQLDMNTGSFAEGVYYVTITSGNSIITKKVVKK